MTLILNDDDVARLLTMDQCIAALEEAFKDLGLGTAVNIPRHAAIMPGPSPDTYYQFKTQEAGMDRLKVFVQRSDSDALWRGLVGEKPRLQKLPIAPGSRYVGLVFLYSTKTLELLAIFTDGHLQRMRVAGVIGVGARLLARPDACIVGLLGSGWQAETAAWALASARQLRQIRVYSPTAEHRESFSQRLQNRLSIEVIPIGSGREAIRGADIVAAATNSREPVIRGERLEEGMHVSSISIDQTEVDEEVWRRADVVICSSPPGATAYYGTETTRHLTLYAERDRAREIEYARWQRYKDKTYELSQLVLGQISGRTSPSQITYLNKNWGLGIEFAAVAKLVYDRAMAEGVGRTVPTEWFTQTSPP